MGLMSLADLNQRLQNDLLELDKQRAKLLAKYELERNKILQEQRKG